MHFSNSGHLIGTTCSKLEKAIFIIKVLWLEDFESPIVIPLETLSYPTYRYTDKLSDQILWFSFWTPLELLKTRDNLKGLLLVCKSIQLSVLSIVDRFMLAHALILLPVLLTKTKPKILFSKKLV